ncbi:unnamed protein product [Prorocentrum cordatum]|uniref:Uncharacterized protein n=1 Tax=Prorocentrum cordatum TaxID=2364126 RepID=A0ABN9WA03_9DINO|nr:unnamed protein product [Polarella glacialis]
MDPGGRSSLRRRRRLSEGPRQKNGGGSVQGGGGGERGLQERTPRAGTRGHRSGRRLAPGGQHPRAGRTGSERGGEGCTASPVAAEEEEEEADAMDEEEKEEEEEDGSPKPFGETLQGGDWNVRTSKQTRFADWSPRLEAPTSVGA